MLQFISANAYLFAFNVTQRNFFEILLNQTEIRWNLPVADWFGTKRTSIWFQINRKMVNTIWFRVDLIGFWIYFSVCTDDGTMPEWRIQILLIHNSRLKYFQDIYYFYGLGSDFSSILLKKCSIFISFIIFSWTHL